MRIALYAGRFLPSLGGSEIVVDALAREYLKKGHEVFVLCPKPLFLASACDKALPYSVIREPFVFSKTSFLESRYHFLKKAHSAHKFDLIHAQAAFPECYLAARLKEEFGIPLVFTSHGADVCADYRLYRKREIRDKAEAALLAVDIFCALNEELARDFLAFCGKEKRIERVSNGVDLAVFDSAIKNINSEPYILFLGRLSKRKGIDCLISAYAKLENPKAKLIIAGEGREKKNLHKMIKALGLKDRVVFKGAVFGDEKIVLIKNAKFLVVPTISWEACSLVALEAFAARKPIIASNVPGLRHLAEGSGAGKLIEPGDIEGLKSAIEEYLADARKVEEMGEKAYRFVQEFDWPKVAQDYLSLYQGSVAK